MTRAMRGLLLFIIHGKICKIIKILWQLHRELKLNKLLFKKENEKEKKKKGKASHLFLFFLIIIIL